MANPKGNPQNLQPVRTKDEAKKRGAAGGKKSGEKRRKKRDARESISLLLGLAAQGGSEENLRALGFAEEDLTNMNALNARLFVRAMTGDIAAYKTLMDYGGFHPDQKQKDKESEARIRKMDEGIYHPSGDDADDEEATDVMVVLPDNGREDGPEPVKKPPEVTENEEDGGDG